MASPVRLETGGGLLRPDVSPLVVTRTLRGIPQLEEAVNPAYMISLASNLAEPEIRWKLDHSARVAVVAGEVHEKLGSSRNKQLVNRRAGIAHDSFQVIPSVIGRRWVTAEEKITVLNKPGLPDLREWQIIHAHPQDAATVLDKHGEEEAALLVFNHHSIQGPERSYPHYLNPELVVLEDMQQVREYAIFSAVDVTDALLTPRPYPKWEEQDGVPVLSTGSTKDPLPSEKVREILDTQFGLLVEGETLDFIVATGQKHAGKTIEDFALAA